MTIAATFICRSSSSECTGWNLCQRLRREDRWVGGPGAGWWAIDGAPSRLADVLGFWTLDRTTITGPSVVILSQHTTPSRPMIVPFADLEFVYQSLRNYRRFFPLP